MPVTTKHTEVMNVTLHDVTPKTISEALRVLLSYLPNEYSLTSVADTIETTVNDLTWRDESKRLQPIMIEIES